MITMMNVTFSLCRYIAPEYFMYGRVSNKIDVYAYGVVLLELVTGRKRIDDENPKGEESLVMWVSTVTGLCSNSRQTPVLSNIAAFFF